MGKRRLDNPSPATSPEQSSLPSLWARALAPFNSAAARTKIAPAFADILGSNDQTRTSLMRATSLKEGPMLGGQRMIRLARRLSSQSIGQRPVVFTGLLLLCAPFIAAPA